MDEISDPMAGDHGNSDSASETFVYHDEDSVDIYAGLESTPEKHGNKGKACRSSASPRQSEPMDLFEEIIVEERLKKEASYDEMKTNFVEATSQLQELIQKLQQQETQNGTLHAENTLLKKNICALIKTARSEIGRKDAEINRLRTGRGKGGLTYHWTQSNQHMSQASTRTSCKEDDGTASVRESGHERGNCDVKDQPRQTPFTPVKDQPRQTPFAPVKDQPRQTPFAPVQDQPRQTPFAPVKDQPRQTPFAPVKDQPRQTPFAPVQDQPRQTPFAPVQDQPRQTPFAPVKDQPRQTPFAPVQDQPRQTPFAPVLDQPRQTPFAPVLDQPRQTPFTPVQDQPRQTPFTPVQDQPRQTPFTPVQTSSTLSTAEVSRAMDSSVVLRDHVDKPVNNHISTSIPLVSGDGHVSDSHHLLGHGHSYPKITVSSSANGRGQNEMELQKDSQMAPSATESEQNHSERHSSRPSNKRLNHSTSDMLISGKSKDRPQSHKSPPPRHSSSSPHSSKGSSKDYSEDLCLARSRVSRETEGSSGRHRSRHSIRSEKSRVSSRHRRDKTPTRDHHITEERRKEDANRESANPRTDKSREHERRTEKERSRRNRESTSKNEKQRTRDRVLERRLDATEGKVCLSSARPEHCLDYSSRKKDQWKKGEGKRRQITEKLVNTADKKIKDNATSEKRRHFPSPVGQRNEGDFHCSNKKTAREGVETKKTTENGHVEMKVDSDHTSDNEREREKDLNTCQANGSMPSEESSPNRKLSFMETLNLTLSPVKKPNQLTECGTHNGESEKGGERSPSSLERTNHNDTGEEFYVIDEIEGSVEEIHGNDDMPVSLPSGAAQVDHECCGKTSTQEGENPVPDCTEVPVRSSSQTDLLKAHNEKDDVECILPISTAVQQAVETTETNVKCLIPREEISDVTYSAFSTTTNSAAVTEDDTAASVSPNENPVREIFLEVEKGITDAAESITPACTGNSEVNGEDETSDAKTTSSLCSWVLQEGPVSIIDSEISTDKEMAPAESCVYIDSVSSTVNLETSPSCPSSCVILMDVPEDSNMETGSAEEVASPSPLKEQLNELPKVSSTTKKDSESQEIVVASSSETPAELAKDCEPDSTEDTEPSKEPSSFAALPQDEDSMMLTLKSIKLIPEIISPLTSPVRQVKRAQPPPPGKQPHIKSLSKDLQNATLSADTSSRTVDVNKENKEPGCSMPTQEDSAPANLGNSEHDELEEGEIVSECESEDPPVTEESPKTFKEIKKSTTSKTQQSPRTRRMKVASQKKSVDLYLKSSRKTTVAVANRSPTCKTKGAVANKSPTCKTKGAVANRSPSCKTKGAVAIKSPTCKTTGAIAKRSPSCKTTGAVAKRSPTCKTKGAVMIRSPTCKTTGAVMNRSPTCKTKGAFMIRSPTCKTTGAVTNRSPSCKTKGAVMIRSPTCKTTGAVTNRSPSCKTTGAVTNRSPTCKTKVGVANRSPSCKTTGAIAKRSPTCKTKGAVANRSPTCKRRFKTVPPPDPKTLPPSSTTVEEIMNMFKVIRSQLRRKYMKLHKSFPVKTFNSVIEMSNLSFTDLVSSLNFNKLCGQEDDVKAKLKNIIINVMNKVANNGIVNRIFEQNSDNLKAKLWSFVDGQLDFLFKEIQMTLASTSKQLDNKQTSLRENNVENPEKKTKVEKPQEKSPSGSGNTAKRQQEEVSVRKAKEAPLISTPCPIRKPSYQTGLGSRGKNLKMNTEETDEEPHASGSTQEIAHPTSEGAPMVKSVDKVNAYVRRLSHSGSMLDKSEFELLTEQQTSSLTFNLVSDSQMGDIFKSLLQGSDLLESSVSLGDNQSWLLGTPKKELSSERNFLTGLMTPSKFGTPPKLMAAWASISPCKLASPNPKVQMPLNPAALDESCLLETPSSPVPNRPSQTTAVSSRRTYSILAEDLAVSLTMPSPLKTDSHLSFLHPVNEDPMPTPEEVLNAHFSEDAVLECEDATEHDIHLSLDTDNSSCESSAGRTWENTEPKLFHFKPHVPMQAVVSERSNDHFIVKIRHTSALSAIVPSPLAGQEVLLDSAEGPAILAAVRDPVSSTGQDHWVSEECEMENSGSEGTPTEIATSSDKDDTCGSTVSKLNLPEMSVVPTEVQQSQAEADESAGKDVEISGPLESGTTGPLESGTTGPLESGTTGQVRRKRKKHHTGPKAKQAKTEVTPVKHHKRKHKKKTKKNTERKMKSKLRKKSKTQSPAPAQSPVSPQLSPRSLSAKNVIRKRGEVVVTWTREEDRDILLELKMKGPSRSTFSTLSEKMNKSPSQIAERFAQLMKLFKKKGKMDSP